MPFFGDWKFDGLLSLKSFGLDATQMAQMQAIQEQAAAPAAPAPGDGVIPPTPHQRPTLEDLRRDERIAFQQNRMRCELMMARDGAEREARRISAAQGAAQGLQNDVDEARDQWRDTVVGIAEDLPIELQPKAPYVKVKWGKAARQAYHLHNDTAALDAAHEAAHSNRVAGNTAQVELGVRRAEIARLTNQLASSAASTSTS